jgi:hypothetical protein
MFDLPISGLRVRLRVPEGRDELLFAEGAAGMHPAWLRVEAVRRLAPPVDESTTWDGLPYADVDAALLALRRRMNGDRLVAEVRCSSCFAWCDSELSIMDFLRANRPRRVADVDRRPNGWFAWCPSGRDQDREVRFRSPSVAAVLESTETADAAQFLLQSCVDAEGFDSPEIAPRVSGLLEKLAPPLAGVIRGVCPHCGHKMRGWFDPGAFVLTELQQHASAVFEHVHLLARAYGWTEDAILSLPSRRRAIYAARIQQEHGSA